jgi:hypothetical protein
MQFSQISSGSQTQNSRSDPEIGFSYLNSTIFKKYLSGSLTSVKFSCNYITLGIKNNLYTFYPPIFWTFNELFGFTLDANRFQKNSKQPSPPEKIF